MRQAARTKGLRAPVSSSVSLPAPVGGWNARDSLAQMGKTDAVSLVNWFPATTEVVLRYGHSQHATGLPGQVETIMEYAGGSSSEMWAISDGEVYDVTASGAVGAAVVTGLANSQWQYANVATAGGNFLYMANGVDTPYLYDGTNWTSITGLSTPAITGVTTTTLNSPIVFKTRVWFIQRNTLKTWYLPVNAISGAANPIDMSAVAQLGGYIVAHATWTIDAGTGVDDYYVAVTSKGEVIVYQGTDPSSANTWALKGVWRIGSPVGARCLMKLAGDLLMICQDGVVPLSSALQSSRVNPRVALTDKIQWAVSEAVTSYGGNFGWELFYHPGQNQLWLNVPNAVGFQEQYAMNTVTKAWGQYQGWAANCFALFNDDAYFGADGVVCKAWDTNADNGDNIVATALQSFSNYGAPGNSKRFSMMRPILRTTGAPAINGSINIDFDTTASTASLTFSPTSAAVWDSAVWDSAVWSGFSILQNWQGVGGVGYYGAPQLKIASSDVDVRWVSTDIVFEKGAIL
jgi:hypothetical protein